jgi:hypothetical protein
MATAPTTAMQARASDLLSHADRWARGIRNEDGQPFVLFTGSKGAVYFCSEQGCTCPSFRHRGACSHHVAVQQHVADARVESETETALADLVSCRSCGDRTRGERYCTPCRRRLLSLDDD